MSRRAKAVVLFEYKQNDPKRDTGMKLARQGLVKSIKPGDGFKGIVLSAYGKSVVSPADGDLIAASGLAAINCSWNRLDEIANIPGGNVARHRKLPFLVAANPINYGKAYKLSSAEALAAALAIAGFREDAEVLTTKFQWHDEFWRLNNEMIAAYVECADSVAVCEVEAKYLQSKRDGNGAGDKGKGYEQVLAELFEDVDGDDWSLADEEGEWQGEDDDGESSSESEDGREEEGSYCIVSPVGVKSVRFIETPEIREFEKPEKFDFYAQLAKLGHTFANPDEDYCLTAPEVVLQVEDVVCAAVPDAWPKEAPKDQKKVLLQIRDLPNSLGEKFGVKKFTSGNVLAKLKRSEYFSIWNAFTADQNTIEFYPLFKPLITQ